MILKQTKSILSREKKSAILVEEEEEEWSEVMGEIEDPPDTGGRSGRSDENGRQNKQRVKFEYTIRDEAPYRVYFELRGGPQQGPQGGRINKFSLGSMLRELQGYKNHIIDMKQIGRNKIMVVFNSYIKANAIVEFINNENGLYTAYIPKHVVCISGVDCFAV